MYLVNIKWAQLLCDLFLFSSFTYLFIYLIIYLLIYSTVYLPIYLCIYLFNHLCIYLFICMYFPKVDLRAWITTRALFCSRKDLRYVTRQGVLGAAAKVLNHIKIDSS